MNPKTVWQCRDIPGWMTEEELRWLARTAEGVSTWTELGVFCGRSLLSVGLNLPSGARLTAVDTELGMQKRAGQSLLTTYEQLAAQRTDLEIYLIKQASVRAATCLPASEVVFIDADHSYEGCKQDILAWRGKCRILCGHDYGHPRWPGVKQAVDELVPKADHPVGKIWVGTGRSAQG